MKRKDFWLAFLQVGIIWSNLARHSLVAKRQGWLAYHDGGDRVSYALSVDGFSCQSSCLDGIPQGSRKCLTYSAL